MHGSDGSLLVAQDEDIGGDDALKLRQKSEVGPSLNSNSPCKWSGAFPPKMAAWLRARVSRLDGFTTLFSG